MSSHARAHARPRRLRGRGVSASNQRCDPTCRCGDMRGHHREAAPVGPTARRLDVAGGSCALAGRGERPTSAPCPERGRTGVRPRPIQRQPVPRFTWMRRNIAGFGGDPERVTIFGRSAGGASILSNLVSPSAHVLFQRAIVESGAYALQLPSLDQAEANGRLVAARHGTARHGCAAADAATAQRPSSTAPRCRSRSTPPCAAAGSTGRRCSTAPTTTSIAISCHPRRASRPRPAGRWQRWSPTRCSPMSSTTRTRRRVPCRRPHTPRAAHASELQCLFTRPGTPALTRGADPGAGGAIAGDGALLDELRPRVGAPDRGEAVSWPSCADRLDTFQSLAPPSPRPETGFAIDHERAFWQASIDQS